MTKEESKEYLVQKAWDLGHWATTDEEVKTFHQTVEDYGKICVKEALCKVMKHWKQYLSEGEEYFYTSADLKYDGWLRASIESIESCTGEK
jgi:hypothetical protein